MPWQPAPIIYPDVELLVTSRLRTLLAARGEADVFVGPYIPDPKAGGRRKRMVIVNRDGGNVSNLTDRPRVRVRVWDQTDQKANDLARLIVALMQRLVDGAPVTRVEHLSGPIEIPDESKEEQRYLLFELHTQGVPL